MDLDFTGKVALITGGGQRHRPRHRARLSPRAAPRSSSSTATRRPARRPPGSSGSRAARRASSPPTSPNRPRCGTMSRRRSTPTARSTASSTMPASKANGRTPPNMTRTMFDAVIGVNVKGVFLGLRHVLPVMLQQKRGAIVNTASVAGLVATPGMPAYVASKHAVIGLTKTAAGEVARQGIRVNAVCPGPVDTRMIHSLEAAAQPVRPGERQPALPIGHPDGPLRRRRRRSPTPCCSCAPTSPAHHRRAIRHRRRPHRHRRRGDPGGRELIGGAGANRSRAVAAPHAASSALAISSHSVSSGAVDGVLPARRYQPPAFAASPSTRCR